MLRSFDFGQIRMQDPWFQHYRDLIRDVVLPYQWDALHDRIQDAAPSHCVKNLELAAMKNEGIILETSFDGFIFQDSDLAKWLEAVAYTLAVDWDEELFDQAESMVSLLARAQEADGYLNSYFTVVRPDRKWKNLADCHELYVMGHLIEAAVAYTQATNTNLFLEIAKKMADLLVNNFGPEEGKIHGYPGHEEIEIALLRLWEITQEETYLQLAEYFIFQRGQKPNYFIEERKREDFFAYYPGSDKHLPRLDYHQAHLPVMEQEHATGHAVRALYLYTAMAKLAGKTKNQALLERCEILWDDIVQHQMYVTGGVGQSGAYERFTCPNDLPNDGNYSETCANLSLAFFSKEMADCIPDAKYHDVVELELFNGVASGVSSDGKAFFYVNPMEVWPENCISGTSRDHVKADRQAWFPCACCPPNLARFYANMERYLYSIDEDTGRFYIHQYLATSLEHKSIRMELTGDYAREGRLQLLVVNQESIEIGLRIPTWAKSWQLQEESQEDIAYTMDKGYAIVQLDAGEHKLALEFPIESTYQIARPEVRANRGLVSLRRGPLIFACEEVDNGNNLASIVVDSSVGLRVESVRLANGLELPMLVGQGVRERYESWPAETLYLDIDDIEKTNEPVEVKWIPYAFWGNRGNGRDKHAGEMRVWMRRSDR